jgi:uncharacterized membrane protein
MNLRLPLTLSVFLVAVMAAISAWAWVKLPDSAVIATHWGFDGKVNGTMPKDWGLSLLPAIGAAITLLLAFVPRIEPRRANMLASRKAFIAFWLGGLVVLAVAHAMMVGTALGFPVDVPGVLIIFIPLMIAFAGNYLGKVRPNFFLGVRTPWTLSSDLSWEKSHRLLGRLFVLSALATLAVRFTLGTESAFIVLAASVAGSGILAIACSYVYWKHDPERRTA